MLHRKKSIKEKGDCVRHGLMKKMRTEANDELREGRGISGPEKKREDPVPCNVKEKGEARRAGGAPSYNCKGRSRTRTQTKRRLREREGGRIYKKKKKKKKKEFWVIEKKK